MGGRLGLLLAGSFLERAEAVGKVVVQVLDQLNVLHNAVEDAAFVERLRLECRTHLAEQACVCEGVRE